MRLIVGLCLSVWPGGGPEARPAGAALRFQVPSAVTARGVHIRTPDVCGVYHPTATIAAQGPHRVVCHARGGGCRRRGLCCYGAEATVSTRGSLALAATALVGHTDLTPLFSSAAVGQVWQAIAPYLETRYTAMDKSAPAKLGAEYTPRFLTSSDLRDWIGNWSLFMISCFPRGSVRNHATAGYLTSCVSPRILLLSW